MKATTLGLVCLLTLSERARDGCSTRTEFHSSQKNLAL